MSKELEIQLNNKIYNNGELEVYEGIELSTGKHIIEKRILNYKKHPMYSDLLYKEYHLLKMMDNPYVVKTVGLYEEGTSLILVNEFVEGKPLKVIIQENKLGLEEKVEIAKALFKAIGRIHRQRILHKDINPTNIIWNEKKHHLTIIDFNISEQAQTQKIEFVSPEHLKGTLAYISPEQTGRMNRILDYRSDFYSAGATLYELFTGVLPFSQDDRNELIHRHIAMVPRAPHLIEPMVPINISAIIMKLIQKNAEDRYQSIEGVLFDLNNCMSEGSERPFVLGQADAWHQLSISQKVYGREEVIFDLMEGFEDALHGKFSYHFIKGYSGVGKTTVTRELYLPITQKSGYFISGKYDQFNASLPYSGVLQCIEDFINLILVEDKVHIDQWRNHLKENLGDYAGLLVQFIPSLTFVMGQQDLPPQMPIQEAQNRFREALQQLFIAFGKMSHPVVMFLDDLQWIDQASIQLIKGFFENKDLKNFYFIGAYRDNEVKKGHRLQVLMESISGFKEDRVLALTPLKHADIDLLIEDTFGQLINKDLVIDKIIEKTKGNAFFIKQLLHHFYDQKCIVYKEDLDHWVINIDCFDKELVTDNVADFLSGQIEELSVTLTEILKAGACFGNAFKLQTLEKVIHHNAKDLLPNIMVLIDEGYLLALGVERYAFSHDQIQQVAYNLMDPSERGALHVELADILASEESLLSDEEVFDIAGHYRRGLADDAFVKDKYLAVKYFIKAADIASRNIAYDEALSFYMQAEMLINNENMELAYDDTKHLYNQLINMFYMVGAFDSLDAYVKRFYEMTKKPYDMTSAYAVQIQSFIARTEFEKGVKVMMAAFDHLGIKISLQAGPKDYEAGFTRLAGLMENRSIESLASLSLMTDKHYLGVQELLAGVIPLVFNAAPQIFPLMILEIVCLSIEYGQTVYAPIAYAFLGTLFCSVVGDVESGIQYGQLSLNLLDILEAKAEIPKVYMVVAQHVGHYEAHYDKMIDLNEKAYYQGVALGDYTYAGFAGHGYCFNSYLTGRPLEKTLSNFESFTNSLESINQGTQSLFQYIYMQTIENIIEKERDPWILEGQWFNEFEQVPEIYAGGHQTALMVYYFNKMQVCYLFNQWALAEEMAKEMAAYLDAGVGLTHVPIYHQYSALIQLAQIEGYSSEEDKKRMQVVENHIAYLQGLSHTLNYGHRLKSVLAEVARVKGDNEVARRLYEEIIAEVDDLNYIREEAMYRELFSNFYQAIGNEELSLYYKQQAYNCYKLWGAHQKVKALSPKIQLGSQGKNTSIYTLHSLNTAVDNGVQIDMYSILKFSQTMAKEIVYEELLRKLLYILLENAGAERVIVVNFNQEGRVVIAENSTDKSFHLEVVNRIEDYEGLPLKILRYAHNGQKIVRLDSAYASALFGDDTYVHEQRVRSALCLPLMNKGELIGLIYMENNLTDGVFSSERTEFLSLLSSQVAISIENAMVYRHLEDLVEQRTNDLAMKNKELQDLNQRLQESAIRDGLTGLYNRRKLDEVLAFEYEKARRHQSDLGVVLVDLDYFKQVNDVHGHLVGDQVLISVARVLKDNLQPSNVVGRWGGEEFLIICPESSLEEVKDEAETIRKQIEGKDFDPVKNQTASFGIALLEEGEAIKDLIKRADDSLYKAKDEGRNKVMVSNI